MYEKSEGESNNSACSGKTGRWKVLPKKRYQFSRNVCSVWALPREDKKTLASILPGHKNERMPGILLCPVKGRY